MRAGHEIKFIVLIPVIVFAIYLVLVPLVFLIWASFRSAPFGFPGELTWNNYIRAYNDSRTYILVTNTVSYAVCAAAISTALGGTFAWLLERTDIPLKATFYSLLIIPLAIPGVLFSIAWVLLLSPVIGIVNVAIKYLLGLSQAPINIYSFAGMSILEGIYLTPAAFLLMAAAFRSMDPSLEEASEVAGAGVFTTFNRVTARILRPAIFAALMYVLIAAMESFEIPGVIGLRKGIHVLATAIYLAKEESPPDYGLISTLSMLLLLLSVGLVALYGKSTRLTERFATVTGKGYRPKIIDIGIWKYPAAAFLVVYFTVTVVLPFFVLVWASILPFYQPPSVNALAHASLDNYRAVWSYPGVGKAILNTLAMVLLAPTIVMLMSAIIAWIVVRWRPKGSKLLDVVTFLPHAVPGVVVGVSLLWTYQIIPIPILGTMGILLIAYITTRLPFGTRTMNAAMLQLHKELEEVSYTSGASWFQTFRHVVIPLLKPAFSNGWIFTAILVSKLVGTVIMIYSNQSVVVSLLVWELWSNGSIPETSTLGVMLISVLMFFVLIARRQGNKWV